MRSLLEVNDIGLYCPQADVYIDPWRRAERALITHAHSDHARQGHGLYMAHKHSEGILKHRLGNIRLENVEYGQKIYMNSVEVSFHPAGHILGSAQVRLEYKGEVVVVSGDYKVTPDGVSAPFEPVKCHTFITESTFGLPIYDWKPDRTEFDALQRWWKHNAEEGICSVVFGYSLGKAQRILRNLDLTQGPVYAHGAIIETHKAMAHTGIEFPECLPVDKSIPKENFRKALVIAPPAADTENWLRQFVPFKTAVCSGWMALRGTRRRQNAHKGFAISDHADWKGLLYAIESSEAENILITHGYSDTLARYLREKGMQAEVLNTLYTGDAANENTEADETVH